ncbi:RNA polymerase sigma-70 factor (ECF subfamily) [Nakamurella sp. UYEF19]|uniref:sigma-70 family RNA polymerase sigma factor n=1 Tax=Nakamurella sp. UYEF19 TaxID=1756392 RepID=UPI003395CF58
MQITSRRLPAPRKQADITCLDVLIAPLTTRASSTRPTTVRDHDLDLVAVGHGDRQAFHRLHRAFAAKVFGLARTTIRDQTMAEDVTQDVFLELWRKASRFDPAKGSANSWIMTLTRSRAIDRIRMAEGTRVRDTTWSRREVTRDFDSVTETVLASADHHQVGAALSTLSALQQQAIVMTYFRGLSCTEVATMLRIPTSTVKTRCRDGLIKLRLQLAEAA